MAIEATTDTAAAPSSRTSEADSFHEGLKALLPRLRAYAQSLTRDKIAADDLVHDTVVKALAHRQTFRPGTNLSAWLFRIERNEFISGLRRLRPSVPIDSAIAEGLSHLPRQENRIVMREFVEAFGKLARVQREALLLAVLEGKPYDEIAVITGVSEGTVKSRVSRARDTLERLMLDDDARPSPKVNAPRTRRKRRSDAHALRE
jgi:RNA polymerase sigma-70 factor (ECF subfamily)